MRIVFLRLRPLLRLAPLLLAALCGCPGNKPSTDGRATATDSVEPTDDTEPADGQFGRLPKDPLAAARELVARMRKTYASASAYTDEGVLRWQFGEGGAWQTDEDEFSTRFARPNQLDLKANGLHVVSDGAIVQAVIHDEATGDYDGQYLELKAPKRVNVAVLSSDAVMRFILGVDNDPRIDDGDAINKTPWPLLLLTHDPAIIDFLSGKIGAAADKDLAGKTYRRVRVRQGGRAAMLWIDPDTYLLRRVELPDVDPSLGVRSFVADFDHAAVNGKAKDNATQFNLPRPTGAKVVSFFVTPPIAVDLPSPLFGETVGDFELETAMGKFVKRDELGKTAVILVWFDDKEASWDVLRQLQTVADQYKNKPGIRIYAVSPLPEVVTTESIVASLTAHDVSLPLLRDTTAVGRDIFDVPGAPTVVVLDGQHKVQAFSVGKDPQIAHGLPMLLDQVLAGADPAGDLRRRVAKDAAQYRRQLAAARAGETPTLVELAQTPLAPHSDPQHMKLTKLWTSDAAAQPGNITVIADGQGPRIFVLDHSADWRTIVELNAAGELVKRRQLPAPEGAAIALLRSIVDRDGRRWYAGSARLARQVFVFNDAFELAFAYPRTDATHEEVKVNDFALVDFQGNGHVQLCVGFWGVLGVHSVDMTGKNLWTNRTAAPVAALAVSPPNALGFRQLLAVSGKGEIVPINGFGHQDPVQQVKGYALTQLFSSGFAGEKAPAYMGLSVSADGAPWAVALSRNFDVNWDMRLPAGVHRNQIQPVAAGKLLPGKVGSWALAGADGTLGVISDDAAFADSFGAGEVLSGLAIAQFGDDRVLLLSTPTGVTAWKVEAEQP